MARNRKHQSGAVRFVPALKTILLCMFIGGSAVGYVLQKNQLYELGRQITKGEAALERIKLENKVRATQLIDMQSPLKLQERIREQKMLLGPPPPGQTIWLAEPTANASPANEGATPMLAVQNR